MKKAKQIRKATAKKLVALRARISETHEAMTERVARSKRLPLAQYIDYITDRGCSLAQLAEHIAADHRCTSRYRSIDYIVKSHFRSRVFGKSAVASRVYFSNRPTQNLLSDTRPTTHVRSI
jgi:hypothetical protein